MDQLSVGGHVSNFKHSRELIITNIPPSDIEDHDKHANDAA